ncbi:hypothetical protein GCM10007898_13180 [Dyella flagellata]|uniref:Uncharacterized protein n=1 Tax=Dyella flagellata TaxID=1867833 RepID=A0ABQ5XB36_9GAMM|nr:hypothetical protein GCM10007898_13180 [Dyella flagellata]
MDSHVIANSQPSIVDETGMAGKTVVIRYGFNTVNDKTYEAVAFMFHARHDFVPIDARLPGMNAKSGGVHHSVRSIRGSDEQFRRHASNPCAGRAMQPAFDQQSARTFGFRGPVSRQASRARADHRNIRMDGSHAGFPLRSMVRTMRNLTWPDFMRW